jgi:hypothetical protein
MIVSGLSYVPEGRTLKDLPWQAETHVSGEGIRFFATKLPCVPFGEILLDM